jgi:radical SAM protein with 4Fe4S-binding SPASM domain
MYRKNPQQKVAEVSINSAELADKNNKFPSPIGNITRQSLTEIYHSDIADRYRKGPDECSSCQLNLVCRGCMASAYSSGLDVFAKKYLFCFFES